VSRCIYGLSQPLHTLVLEQIPANSAPTVQTAKRCHAWLFGRLEPLVETLLGKTPLSRAESETNQNAGKKNTKRATGT